MVSSRTPDSKDISRFRGSKVRACELLTKERLGPGRSAKVPQVEGGWDYICPRNLVKIGVQVMAQGKSKVSKIPGCTITAT